MKGVLLLLLLLLPRLSPASEPSTAIEIGSSCRELVVNRGRPFQDEWTAALRFLETHLLHRQVLSQPAVYGAILQANSWDFVKAFVQNDYPLDAVPDDSERAWIAAENQWGLNAELKRNGYSEPRPNYHLWQDKSWGELAPYMNVFVNQDDLTRLKTEFLGPLEEFPIARAMLLELFRTIYPPYLAILCRLQVRTSDRIAGRIARILGPMAGMVIGGISLGHHAYGGGTSLLVGSLAFLAAEGRVVLRSLRHGRNWPSQVDALVAAELERFRQYSDRQRTELIAKVSGVVLKKEAAQEDDRLFFGNGEEQEVIRTANAFATLYEPLAAEGAEIRGYLVARASGEETPKDLWDGHVEPFLSRVDPFYESLLQLKNQHQEAMGRLRLKVETQLVSVTQTLDPLDFAGRRLRDRLDYLNRFLVLSVAMSAQHEAALLRLKLIARDTSEYRLDALAKQLEGIVPLANGAGGNE